MYLFFLLYRKAEFSLQKWIYLIWQWVKFRVNCTATSIPWYPICQMQQVQLQYTINFVKSWIYFWKTLLFAFIMCVCLFVCVVFLIKYSFQLSIFQSTHSKPWTFSYSLINRQFLKSYNKMLRALLELINGW